MTMYLVQSTFTSTPLSLLASTKRLCFPIQYVRFNSGNQKLMCTVQFQKPWFTWNPLMAVSKAKLKSNGEKASLFHLLVNLIFIELQEFNYTFEAWKSRKWFGKTEFLRLRKQCAFSLQRHNAAQSEYNSKLTNLLYGLSAYHFSVTLILH